MKDGNICPQDMDEVMYMASSYLAYYGISAIEPSSRSEKVAN
jgi:hypothetical protein